jgi:hypothetical protein
VEKAESRGSRKGLAEWGGGGGEEGVAEREVAEMN